MYARRSSLIPPVVLVKQMRKAHTRQSEPAKLIKHWEEGSWCLFPTPLPPSLNRGYRISSWAWRSGLNGSCLSILVPMASSPVPLDPFTYVFPKASSLSPVQKFCLVGWLRLEGCLCNYTITEIHKEG